MACSFAHYYLLVHVVCCSCGGVLPKHCTVKSVLHDSNADLVGQQCRSAGHELSCAGCDGPNGGCAEMRVYTGPLLRQGVFLFCLSDLDCDPGNNSSISADNDDNYYEDSYDDDAAAKHWSDCEAPAGSYCKRGHLRASSSSNMANVLSCPAGKFQPNAGHFVCQTCPRGEYQSKSGMHECDGCPRGNYCEKYVCFAGMTWNRTSGRWETCKGDMGATRAVPCPSGRYQPHANKSHCEKCSAGIDFSGGVLADSSLGSLSIANCTNYRCDRSYSFPLPGASE